VIVFVVYAIALAFLWVRTLLSSTSSEQPEEIERFLQCKYLKIRRYKQYGLLYIVTLFYLVSISMVSARYMPIEQERLPLADTLARAWQQMLGFPLWLQGLFFIGLLLFLAMLIWPIWHFYSDRKHK
jgi:membrane protein implicated in regulation of membrane protease activity